MARARRIQQAPYYDSGSYQRYRGFLSAMRDAMSSAEGSELAGIAQQTSAGVREMRRMASAQPKRIGYSVGRGEHRNYDRYSEYRADDPYRPSMPGSESISELPDTSTEQNRAGMADAGGGESGGGGDASGAADAAMATAVTESGGGEGGGGGGGGDYRTDEEMKQLAESGKLEGFKDSRSREYNDVYGPGGVFSDDPNLSEDAQNVQQKLRQKIKEYADLDDKKFREEGPVAVSGVRNIFKSSGQAPYEQVLAYTTGGYPAVKTPKTSFTVGGQTGMVNPMSGKNQMLVNAKYLDDEVTEDEELYWEIQGLKDQYKQAKKQDRKEAAAKLRSEFAARQLQYKTLNDQYSGG